MRFLDIKTDYAFKKVFGSKESKDILLSFLNAVLILKAPIMDLTIEDPYNVPKLQGMKDTAVDVKAQLQDNSMVIIEMQVIDHEGFESRILYNAAKNYANQLKKGEDYNLLNPVIALTIVNFNMFTFDKFKSSFKLYEKEALTNYNDDIELVFIELPKFDKTLEQCDNIEEKWLYFIKNARKLDVVPENVDKALEHAFTIANTAAMTTEEIELQEKREEFLFIQRSSVNQAHTKGKEEGIKQGLQQGIQQGIEAKAVEIALNLKETGLDITNIAKITGLTEDKIKEL